MNYILMDIKKFLKKLETGQMEIEAGQWELHKDITNLKDALQGLKQLKTDLQQMKQYGLKQTDLIKELQTKLNMLEEVDSNDRWSRSSSSSEESQQKSLNNEPIPKVRRKFKNQSKTILRSGKMIGFMSQHSFSRRHSMLGLKPKTEKGMIMKKKGYGRSSQLFRKKSQSLAQKTPKTPPHDHSILQRYLQDSAKYVDRETPRMSYISSKKSCSSQNWKSETIEPNLQGICDPTHKSELDPQDQTKTKLCEKNRKTTGNQEKFGCSVCPKKFTLKNSYVKHKKRHQKAKPLYSCKVCNKYFICKNRLKNHGKVHQKTSKCFRGFRCSYCDKICKSPEKLTAHIKTCRLIKKTRCPSHKKNK